MDNIKYRIGLDIGITSVGYSILANDEYGNPIKILELGSRIFDAAETPKDGSSLAVPRREARSARRRNRRKVHRIYRVKELLKKYNFLSENDIEKLYNIKGNIIKDLYELRYDALSRKLTNVELSRILINFVKKRGYKSNSKAEELGKDKELGKALTAIKNTSEIFNNNNNYRTIGEMLYKDPYFKLTDHSNNVISLKNGTEVLKTRNTTDEYKTTLDRSLILKEIEYIFDVQSKYNELITDEFIQKYIEIFSSQRNFDDGPALPSKYGGNLIESMFGNCIFEKEEKRAPKASYTFEMFKLLQDLNHIKLETINLVTSEKGNIYHKKVKDSIRSLTDEEKVKIVEKYKTTDKLKFNQIRKLLNIPYTEVFNSINYDFRKANDNSSIQIIDECEKNSKELKEMESFHKIRRCLDKLEKNYIYNFDEDSLNSIAYILTAFKSDNNRIEKLKQLNIEDNVISKLLELSFAKVGHLSIKAMKKINEKLKEGITYDKAVDSVYEDFRGTNLNKKKSKLSLNDIDTISNPVVRRAVSQTIKVVNAIVLKYGDPELINIEFARELSKNHLDRQKDIKSNENNMKINEEAKLEIQNDYKQGLNVTGNDIIKYKLWKEQQEICPYSGKLISIKELFTSNVDVDHIIPYSLCFDDSYNNKVLVKADENRQKGNKLALEYIIKSSKNVDEYFVRINSLYQDNKFRHKRNKLLKEEFDSEGFKERDLNNTRYINRVVYNLIRNNLKFNDDSKYKNKPIKTLNGKVTAHIRKRLGFTKFRDAGDKHHALDATIIAIVTESMIQKVTNYYKVHENKYNTEKKEDFDFKFPEPYPDFVEELKLRLLDTEDQIKFKFKSLKSICKLKEYSINEEIKPIFVSRMPNRKVTGSAHGDTIRKLGSDNKVITKVSISELKLVKDKITGEFEIENYYNPKDDRLLYEALKKRLIEFKETEDKENSKDKKKTKDNGAFKEPFYKPKSDGTLGPIVKKVKISTKSSSNVPLPKMNAVANNGDTLRIDVFKVENEGYYLVPIYVHDTVKDVLPNKASVAAKQYSDWKEMKEENFVFSLYPNDLVYIKFKKESSLTPINNKSKKLSVNEMFGYYRGTDISSANITLITHDKFYQARGIGIKTLPEISKYTVDILGNYHKVKTPEKRMGFKNKKK